ncbi:ATP-binding protein [Candidatus Pacearchaeota archaeon]|nr:ATP-binding protein [Candidatus Pacearchaeota archaeon]
MEKDFSSKKGKGFADVFRSIGKTDPLPEDSPFSSLRKIANPSIVVEKTERKDSPVKIEVSEPVKEIDSYENEDPQLGTEHLGSKVVRVVNVLGSEHRAYSGNGNPTSTVVIESNGEQFLAGIWYGINPGLISVGDTAVYDEKKKMVFRIIDAESPSAIPRTTFDDIGGLVEQKKDLVSLLSVFDPKERTKCKGLNRKFMNAALLYGPSGTGKTTLARAAANYAKIPFFEINTAEIFGSHLGESVQNLKSKIVAAQKFAKKYGGAIVYFDEVTRLAAERNYSGGGADREVSGVTEALQSFMNGEHYLDESEGMILYLASTNLATVFDSAVLGRFKKHILVPAPTTKEKREIFEVKVRNVKTRNLEFNSLVKDLEALNPNASGRDIDTITEIAKESAYTVGREVLMMIDYDFALGKYSQRVNIALSKKSTE